MYIYINTIYTYNGNGSPKLDDIPHYDQPAKECNNMMFKLRFFMKQTHPKKHISNHHPSVESGRCWRMFFGI